jgi:pimeloyl-ACP methyl ester carboxylesterase
MYPSEPPPARLQLLERLLPGLAARIAEHWFFRPGKRSAALDTSDADVTFDVRVRGVTVTVAGWGQGPAVVGVHGWAGGAAQLTTLLRAVVAAGFSFFSFDAPAHGGAPSGSADVGVFADALAAVSARLGNVHAVVAHSLGATAAALAVSRGLTLRGLVMIAPIPSLEFALERFVEFVGLSRTTREQLGQRAAERAGLQPSEHGLLTLGAGVGHVLVIHDRSDRMVPVEQSRDLARHWPHARLIETERRGHNRILQDSEVARSTAAYLAALPPTRASALERQLGALDQVCF